MKRRDEEGPRRPRQTVYLIDGVKVPKRIFERRQRFGEYVGARFEVEGEEEGDGFRF